MSSCPFSFPVLQKQNVSMLCFESGTPSCYQKWASLKERKNNFKTPTRFVSISLQVPVDYVHISFHEATVIVPFTKIRLTVESHGVKS